MSNKGEARKAPRSSAVQNDQLEQTIGKRKRTSIGVGSHDLSMVRSTSTRAGTMKRSKKFGVVPQRLPVDLSSDESWHNDSDHFLLKDDPTWKNLQGPSVPKRERKDFKRKFIANREAAKKKEILRKFIDNHKVGICVDNPQLMKNYCENGVAG